MLLRGGRSSAGTTIPVRGRRDVSPERRAGMEPHMPDLILELAPAGPAASGSG